MATLLQRNVFDWFYKRMSFDQNEIWKKAKYSFEYEYFLDWYLTPTRVPNRCYQSGPEKIWE